MKRTLYAIAALCVLATVIVVISAQLSSVEAGKCDTPGKAMARFSPTDPPRPVVDEPFKKGENEVGTLSDYFGKGLVVNFWATWCVPCIEEMPALIELKQALGGDGIEVIAISEDRKDSEEVRKFMLERDLDALGLLIDPKGRVGRQHDILGLPTTLLINDKGMEVGRVVGMAAWNEGEAIRFVRDCLGPEPKT